MPPEKSPAGEPPEWTQRQERGSIYWLRVMGWLSLTVGRGLSRGVLYGIALYFVLAVPAARKASRAYLAQVLERPITWRDLYRHILAFASTIHDRFYLLSQRSDLFDIRVTGAELLCDLRDRDEGALLFSAHLGSFEMLLDHARTNRLHTCVAMYPENARQLNSMLAAINPLAAKGIIALGRFDSMLAIHQELENGALVGILADRSIGQGKYISAPFFGKPAQFPSGPFRMAAMLKRPVYFMTALYLGGNRYDVHFELLTDFSDADSVGRDAATHTTLLKYVAAMERHCRQAPFNWFNFYDFWEPTHRDPI